MTPELADLLRVVTQPMKIYLIIPNEAPYWFENGPYIDYSAEYEFLKKDDEIQSDRNIHYR